MGIISAITAFFSTSCSDRNIHVEFINSRDKSAIGVSDLPLDQLPDSFAVDTTLDIADKKWSVTKAEPVTKAEFAKSRRLRVFLEPVSMISPGQVLFSLPTISDEFGACEGSNPPDETIFQIHEDDWRQVEIVNKIYDPQIESEFADIRSIYTNRTPSGGFKNVHVRKRVPAPLSNTKISLTELERSFPPRRKYKALGINRSLGAIHHSFAWDIDDGVTLWGTTDERNQVHVICLALGVRGHHANADWITALGRFCADRNLCLVDWCKVAKGADAKEIHALLEN